MDDLLIRQHLNNTLVETNFAKLGSLYRGKVRDNYTLPDGRRIIIASDRLSAFDRVLTSIPFKGQLLNQMTNFWFEKNEESCAKSHHRDAGPKRHSGTGS
jgi:phosphoribosylaminoimidazole-succinocarboxamide synthase